MALETRIPKEITEYREKIVFGMSGRQLASVAMAAAAVLVTGLVLWRLLKVPFAIVEYVLIAEALPFVAWGFIRHRGVPFEEAVRIRRNFRSCPRRLHSATDLEALPSLYPVAPAPGPRKIGVRSEIQRRREIRRRRRRGELVGEARGPKGGGRHAR